MELLGFRAKAIVSVHDNQKISPPRASDTDDVSEKPEASIDYSTLIPSLNEALLEACGAFSADLLLVRYLQRLESIFTGVPIPCDVLFTDPLSSELNGLSHIRDPFLSSLHQWTKKKLSMNSFSRVVGWSFIHFLDPQCPRSIHFHNISDASQSSVHAGLKAWVHNLLPLLLVDNSQKTHQWTELILDIVEKGGISAFPQTTTINPCKGQIHSAVIHRFLKLAGIKGYPVVAKEAATIALHFLTENDDVCWKCWRYLGEGIPVVVAKDARKIAIWCLMENVDCWRHWDNLYKMNVKVGVALLKTLVDECKDHSFKLPSSPE
ncbi:hypothetical protein Bca101_035648 [Brassica carinata]